LLKNVSKVVMKKLEIIRPKVRLLDNPRTEFSVAVKFGRL
jgi:hypothetical protein